MKIPGTSGSPSGNVKAGTVGKCKVLVIGAGASGLMAAHNLVKEQVVSVSSHELLVLEARDRVGGRIHTTEDLVLTDTSTTRSTPTKQTKLYRDHGAAWVHGTGCDWPHYTNDNADDKAKNPMMGLLEELTPAGESVCATHLEPAFLHGNPWTRPGHVLLNPNQLAVFAGGTRVQDHLLRDALTLHFQILLQVGQLGHNLIRDGNTKQTVETSLQQALDQIKLHDTDTNPVLSPLAGFYRHLIEAWHATSASGLQLYEFSAFDSENELHPAHDDQWTDEGDFYGPHCVLKKGMETILQPLLQTVSSCLQLNKPVQRITRITNNTDTAATTILVETTDGTIIQTDYCVVTVSLGCLAHSIQQLQSQAESELESESNQPGVIQFIPPLSETKRNAIHSMCMGSYKKVFLTFRHIFWPPYQHFIGLVRNLNQQPNTSHRNSSPLGNYLLLDNLWAAKDIPCIEVVLVGDDAVWATGKSDQTIRKAVLHFLAEAMGYDFETEIDKWCCDCHITRWEEDPYSRGAYSGYRLGTLQEHTEGLAASEWDQHLLFAGEATLSGYEGSVHAALISGITAAEAIQAAMAKQDN